jgi:hypothetical protein
MLNQNLTMRIVTTCPITASQRNWISSSRFCLLAVSRMEAVMVLTECPSFRGLQMKTSPAVTITANPNQVSA